MIRRPDEAHLEYATSLGRAIYSFNIRDYQRIHTQYQSNGRNHSGIIVGLQQRFSLGQQMSRLIKNNWFEISRRNAEFHRVFKLLGLTCSSSSFDSPAPS